MTLKFARRASSETDPTKSKILVWFWKHHLTALIQNVIAFTTKKTQYSGNCFVAQTICDASRPSHQISFTKHFQQGLFYGGNQKDDEKYMAIEFRGVGRWRRRRPASVCVYTAHGLCMFISIASFPNRSCSNPIGGKKRSQKQIAYILYIYSYIAKRIRTYLHNTCWSKCRPISFWCGDGVWSICTRGGFARCDLKMPIESGAAASSRWLIQAVCCSQADWNRFGKTRMSPYTIWVERWCIEREIGSSNASATYIESTCVNSALYTYRICLVWLDQCAELVRGLMWINAIEKFTSNYWAGKSMFVLFGFHLSARTYKCMCGGLYMYIQVLYIHTP